MAQVRAGAAGRSVDSDSDIDDDDYDEGSHDRTQQIMFKIWKILCDHSDTQRLHRHGNVGVFDGKDYQISHHSGKSNDAFEKVTFEEFQVIYRCLDPSGRATHLQNADAVMITARLDDARDSLDPDKLDDMIESFKRTNNEQTALRPPSQVHTVARDAGVMDVIWQHELSVLADKIVCGFQIHVRKDQGEWMIYDCNSNMLNPKIPLVQKFRDEHDLNGLSRAVVSTSARRVQIRNLPPGEYETRIFVCKLLDDESDEIMLGTLARYSRHRCRIKKSIGCGDQMYSGFHTQRVLDLCEGLEEYYNFWDFYVEVTSIFEDQFRQCDVDGSESVTEDEYQYLFKNVLGTNPAVMYNLDKLANLDEKSGKKIIQMHQFNSCMAQHLLHNLTEFYSLNDARRSPDWDELSENYWFMLLCNMAIIVAALADTLSSYPNSDAHRDALYWTTVACLAIFSVECAVKAAAVHFNLGMYFIGSAGNALSYLHMFEKYFCWHLISDPAPAEGEGEGEGEGEDEDEEVTSLVQDPKMTAEGLWNSFDFCIVVIAWCDIANLTSGVSFMRTLRLLRTFKLFGRNQRLFAMLKGLAAGLRASFSIILLWIVLWLLFAFVGVSTMGENNPFSYGSLDAAFMSLYIASTMDWGDIYNVDQYGCNRHDGNDVYTQCDLAQDYCPDLSSKVNAWVAAAPAGTTRTISDFGQTGWKGGSPSYDTNQISLRHYCYAPIGGADGTPRGAKVAIPALFYLLFILLVALILMTLFMGSVSMAMVNVMSTLVKSEKRQNKRLKVQKLREKYYTIARDSGKWPNELDFNFSVTAKLQLATAPIARKLFIQSCYKAGYMLNFAHCKPSHMMNNATPPGDIDWLQMTGDLLDDRTGNESIRLEERRLSFAARARAAVHCFCFWLTQNWYFKRICESAILLGTIGCFLEAIKSQAVVQSTVVPGELMIVTRDSEWSNEVFYISRVTWSVFVTEACVKILAEGDYPLTYFNPYVDPWNLFDFFCIVISSPPFIAAADLSLSGFRMLRLIKWMYGLKSSQSVSGVVKGFGGAITSCKFLVPIWALITYIWAMLGIQSFAHNDPDRFGSFQAACMSLYVFSTFDALSDAMYANMYGSDFYPPTREASYTGLSNSPDFWGAFAYFFSYELLTALILLSAFLGVVQIAMDEESARIIEKRRVDDEIQKFIQYKTKGRRQREQVKALRKTFELMDLDESEDVSQDEIQICKLAAIQQRNPKKTDLDPEIMTEIASFLKKSEGMIEDVERDIRVAGLTMDIFVKRMFDPQAHINTDLLSRMSPARSPKPKTKRKKKLFRSRSKQLPVKFQDLEASMKKG